VIQELPYVGFGVSLFMLLTQIIPHNNNIDMYIVTVLIIGVTVLFIRGINNLIRNKK